MDLSFTSTPIDGLIVVDVPVYPDRRGFFLETYHAEKYARGGLAKPFVQDNCSHSVKGTLRGLHYQLAHPQAKLVCALQGAIWDVALDIRRGSPTFGRWFGVTLSGENHRQLYIPEGFAHGFCVLTETADVLYKCTDLYAPGDDHGVLWCDPEAAIEWPVQEPLLSDKDARLPALSALAEEELPHVRPAP